MLVSADFDKRVQIFLSAILSTTHSNHWTLKKDLPSNKPSPQISPPKKGQNHKKLHGLGKLSQNMAQNFFSAEVEIQVITVLLRCTMVVKIARVRGVRRLDLLHEL